MDSTPLLAASGLPGGNTMQDHPAFLRVCHSPWPCIPQNVLVIIRGILVSYLAAAGILIIDYKLKEPSDYSDWRLIYDFSLIAFAMAFLYQLIAFSWTFTHLYYPNGVNSEGMESVLINIMALPSNLSSLRRQFYFTLFYTLAVVFAFQNSTIYWFIEREQGVDPDPAPPGPSETPSAIGTVWTRDTDTSIMADPEPPFNDVFDDGPFRSFVLLNLYAITSLIMVIEILWLNSIRRPYTIGSHLFSAAVGAALYLAWAGIGRLLNGSYAFFFLIPSYVGSEEAVVAYCIGFVFLAPIMYIFMQGIVGLRDGLTRSVSEARAVAAAHAALES